MSSFVAPTGYVDLDNDCEYSIDRKSIRSRESVDPKTDLSFYFNTYIVPKYGLNNINVSNAASFMKELQMNWTKMDAKLQEQVMDIMVDGILNKDSDFKTSLLNKLGPLPSTTPVPAPPSVVTKESFDESGKESFGSMTTNQTIEFAVLAIIGGLIALIIYKCSRANVRFK